MLTLLHPQQLRDIIRYFIEVQVSTTTEKHSRILQSAGRQLFNPAALLQGSCFHCFG